MPLRSNPRFTAVPDCVSDLSLARQPGGGRGLPAHLAFLRERAGPGLAYAGALPFGDARVDGCFPPQMGGLPLGALHEIGAEGRGAETGELPAAFAATLIAGICGSLRGRGQAPVLWVATVPDLYPPGLPGLDPARLVLVNPRNEAGVLAALEIALRAGGFAAVVGEVGAMDRVASRRLAFACQKHGVTAFVLRRWPHGNRVPDRQASAAATRWVLAPAPRLGPRLGPWGRWQVTLTHVRGGRGGSWLMEVPSDIDSARAGGKTVPVRVVAALADHTITAPPDPRGSVADARVAGNRQAAGDG